VAASLSLPAVAGHAVSPAAAESAAARFERVMAEHGPSLARLAACYERDPNEREDLLQDIALAIWTALPRFRGDSSERTFVFRIAHNRGLTYRSRRRPPPATLAEAEAVPDPSADPAALVERGQRRDLLLAAVRALPVSQRQAVALRLEGLANQEIAEVLGLTENAVAVRLSRALHTLRTLLAPSGGDR
jgi:RNA polymerase sigma-70 factor (ECF subfamily)